MAKGNKKNHLQNFFQQGQVSRFLLILAVVVLVAAVIVFLVMKMAQPPAPPKEEPNPEVPLPVYEDVINDIRFVFINAKDMGNTLRGSLSRQPEWQKDIATTERFIILTVGAQNKGKENVPAQAWDIQNIIDSEGRNYVPMDYTVDGWLPDPDLCSTLLKPEFDPAPCVKIYEVSKAAVGLKVRALANRKDESGRYKTGSNERDEVLLDLIVK